MIISTYSLQNDFVAKGVCYLGRVSEDYRTGKNVTDSTGIKNIQYFYDGSRVIMEADGSGSITSHNLYGAHLAGRSVPGEDYYYLYNAHGDVVMLLDVETGTIAGTYRYDAFGNVILQTGTPDNSITYAGYQYDEETGLYYLNARYYDSSTARFLTEDTFRGRYQDPLSLNRYTYCHNNPVAYTDPSGHFIIGALLSGGLGALVGGGMELISQKVFQKKDKIDWKAVRYEAGIGALFGALGGVAGGVAKTAGKTVVKTTVKSVAKKAVTTGAMEAVEGFASDVGRQVIVDGKSLSEVDYEQAFKTGAIAGAAGVGGYAIGVTGDVVKTATKKTGGNLTEIATKNLDDVVEAADDSVVKTMSKNDLSDTPLIKKGSVVTTKNVEDVSLGQTKTQSALDKNKGIKVVVPNKGFNSFGELKNYMGSPGEGNAWHHIVEQSQIGKSRFSSTKVHNVNNIIAIPHGRGSVHAKISGFYSSKPRYTNGLTVREWLSRQSFDEQFDFGMKVLRKYGDVIETSEGWKFIPFD